MNGFYYLASPYSSNGANFDERHERASIANDYAGHLLQRGVFTYQAIWSTHRIAILHRLPKEHEFWIALNKAFIDASMGIIVCDMPGWQTSSGVQQEIQYARSLGKPVRLCRAINGYVLEELQ